MQSKWIAVCSVAGFVIAPAGNPAWAQAPGPPLDYFSVTPCRLLDTRVPAQGPALASGASRLVAVPGSCGIPAGASAIAANITAVASTGAGNLRLYPGDGTVPPTTALNFGAGQTRANNGVFALANNGTLGIFAAVAGGGTVHAVLDVTGYFAVVDVFVSPSGNDGNSGTCAQPLLTIQAAIDLAASLGRNVFVIAGSYDEASTIQLADGVSLLGGFASNCTRPESGVSEIVVGQPRAIFATGITAPTTLDLLTIRSADNPNPGGSAYGVLVVNSTGLAIRRSTIVAGSGGDGQVGSNGAAGGDGSNGGTASGTSQGGGGSSPSGANGGQGGPGVVGVGSGNPGGSGTQTSSGGSGATGGSSGASGSCSFGSSSNGGSAPAVSGSGGPGNPGSNGGPGTALGTLDAAGNYLPPAGGDGITGLPGGGGGGGGSGGGTARATIFPCSNCSGLASGAGGGGGGGASGGGPGQGGRGAGASFAIAIVASSVIVDATATAAGDGGNGGVGGNGGDGGSGGPGGAGAQGQTSSNACVSRSAGNGASGSAGGPGGKGGGGAGGTGGASVCIAYKGTAPTTANITCTNGSVGLGGAGGTNGVTTAPKGTDGTAGVVLAVP